MMICTLCKLGSISYCDFRHESPGNSIKFETLTCELLPMGQYSAATHSALCYENIVFYQHHRYAYLCVYFMCVLYWNIEVCN